MSFINISKKTDTFEGKFKKAKIICPYCKDESLDLKWRGRNSQGRPEYTDVLTDSLHICKKKAGKTCKYCGETDLMWIKSVDTQSGVELADQKGNLHKCPNRKHNDYFSQWDYFFDRVVILDADPEETKRAKTVWQDKHRHKFTDKELQLMKEAQPLMEKWRKHDFSTVKKKWKVSK